MPRSHFGRMKVAWHLNKSNFVIGHIWLVLFSEGTGRAVYICLYLITNRIFKKTQCLQLEVSKLVIKIVDASNPVALIKTFIKIPPENKLVVSNAVFHTGRLLHTSLWAHTKASVLTTSWSRNSGPLDWFSFMICLGWWAGTTGPPRIPPSQGCEHLCVMSFIPKKFKIKKCNSPKVQCTKRRWQNTLRNWSKFYRSSRCVRVRNFKQKKTWS